MEPNHGSTVWTRWLPPTLGLVLFGPYLLAGPGYFIDDWFTLRNARVDGAWMAAGADQWRARPVASALYALTFGLLDDFVVVAAAVSATLIVLSAVLLNRIVRREWGRPLALIVSTVWLVVPTHTSLEMWLSAQNITLALVLGLFAVDLASAHPTRGGDIGAAIGFALGSLAYEAILPAGIVALVAVGLRRRRRGQPWRRLVAMTLATQTGVAVWMVANWHPAKAGLDRWLDPQEVFIGHFGTSSFGFGLVGRVAAAVFAIALGAVGGRRLIQGRWAVPQTGPVLAWGAGLIGLGVIPFVRYFYAPLGFGDRVTVVSGIGAALLIGGAVNEVHGQSRGIGLAMAVVLGVAALVARVDMTSRYIDAADDGRSVLAAVENRFPTSPSETLVFVPPPTLQRNVGPFLQMDWPIQALYGNKSVSASVAPSAEVEADPHLVFVLRRLTAK